MRARWDGDPDGHGIGEAARLVPGAGELVAAFSSPDWVAEEPELHLLPHIEAWCQQDQRFSIVRAYTDDAHAYALDLEWRGPTGGLGQVRAAAFALLGSFAESATYVRQRWVPSEDDPILRFEVGTGELAPEAGFEPHGHVVLINVVSGVR